MASTGSDALIDALRALRAEERALVAIVDKARASGANEQLIRDHRRRLAQVRRELEERLPEAIAARDHCHDAIDHLRPQADGIKDRFETLRAQVQLGQRDEISARQVATDLQRQYEAIFERITAQQYGIATLQEFYPGLEASAASRAARRSAAPLPAAAPPAVPPPAVRPPVIARRGARSGPAGGADASSPSLEVEFDLPPPDEDPAAAAAAAVAPLLEHSRVVYDTKRRERRAHPRFPFTVPVKYRSGSHSVLARSSDVGLSGMFIEGHLTMPAGSKMTVLFCAEGFPVEAEAQVIYETQGVGMGVRFLHLSEADRPPLEAELARRRASG